MTDWPAKPPRAVEAILLACWQEEFERGDLGRDDDFFALGGDSLTALRILMRANDYGITLDLIDIFECPTVATLADRVQ